ncbi:MAG TPA: gliding motility-associated C-terminal domain-containing protein [Chitinophagaceae bacterium]|nr:gliding motility-associated C-terminal domain-containing protein [Chitinophagaceae bacterium]
MNRCFHNTGGKKIAALLLLLFLITKAQSQTVKAIEYFFNTDPGPGNGKIIPLTPGAQIDTVVNFDMSGLGFGLHRLYIRAQDSDNQWGLYHVYPVIKGQNAQPILVERVEYFFDNDPGPGNGIQLNFSPAALKDTTLTFNTTGIADGLHRLYIRARDNTGKWGIYHVYPFIKAPGNYQPLTVQRIEAFFDVDPGVGNGIQVPLNPGYIVDDTVYIPIPNLPKDTTTLYVRAQDNRGLWGLYHDTTLVLNCDFYNFKPSFSFSDTHCVNKNITFNDSSAASQWKWHFGDGDSSSLQHPVHAYRTPGTYTVSLYVTNVKGCVSDTAYATVTIHSITVDAGPDVDVYLGQQHRLQPIISGNDSVYNWQPPLYLDNNGLKNPLSTPTDNIVYTLTVTSKGKCTASDSIKIKVIKDVLLPRIPNLFTPNNDGINDTWVIQNLDRYPSCRVSVYNRYGQKVFESTGYSVPWNGTMNGRPLPFGTYYYVIESVGTLKPFTGYVTIIK